MRLRPRHVRTRLTLWYVLVLAAILIVYAAGTSTFFLFSLREELDANLLQDFETVEGLLEPEANGLLALRAHHPEAEEPERLRFLEVWSPDGKLLFRSANLSPDSLGGPPTPNEGKGELVAISRAVPNGPRLRMVTSRYFLEDRPLVIRLAHSEERLWHELGELLGGIAFGIPITLVVAGLGGYLLARRALAPVDAMTKRAAEVSVERLNERLPVETEEDELGQLALVLNRSLDRLQAAFDQLRRFTADASHELRTPLTAVRSVGEVALQDERAPGEYREVIGSMLEEVDRLTRLVDSLLVLSRADAGSVSLHRSRVPLMELAREAVSLVEVLAEEKSQKVTLTGDATVQASVDRLILRQGIINLLDNAIKYSPPGANVSVRVAARDKEGALLEVEDQGPGISLEHRHKVFERFFRTDPARSGEQGGAGLGLAIADWAVKAHGGSIELESEEDGGSIFRIVLPAAEPAAGWAKLQTGGQS